MNESPEGAGGTAEAPGAIALPLTPVAGSGPGGDGLFELGEPARGPWRPDAAHGGAPAALLTRAIEAHAAPGSMRLVSFQSVFLGPVTLGPVELTTEVLKPGRRQMVIGARLSAGGRTLVDARGVLLRSGRVDLPEGVESTEPGMPGPETGHRTDGGRWGSGEGVAFQRTSNTIRLISGGPEQDRSDGAAWFRLDSPVIPGEDPSPAQRAVAAADFGNGLAHPVSFGEFVFVNCDLNVWLLREPVGVWIGVSSTTEVSPNGSGVTRTALHDSRGRFGTAGQALYVDRAG